MADTSRPSSAPEAHDRASRAASEDLVAAYQRDGAVVLRAVFDEAELALLSAGIEANLASLGPRAIVASKSDDPGRFVEDFCRWTEIPEYRRFLQESPLAAIAGRLMESRVARFYHDHMLTKESGTRQTTPWHQDQPYYNVDGRQNVSFWIPIDPIPRDSTLELVAGSHLGPWLMPRTFLAREARWFPDGTLAEIPDIDAGREAFPILGWALEPGDCVAFHMLTLHGSPGVRGPSRRRVFSARFLGEDARHAPRRWKTSPDFPGLERDLPPGAPLEHPLFPVLWTAR
jgi:ectoine hydroxylase-related dioxygenase (phytanoyl-CoA dioxygenase family)